MILIMQRFRAKKIEKELKNIDFSKPLKRYDVGFLNNDEVRKIFPKPDNISNEEYEQWIKSPRKDFVKEMVKVFMASIIGCILIVLFF